MSEEEKEVSTFERLDLDKLRGPVKFIRLGEGTYTFGSKKIRVKLSNGKLVIRIGGGYMMIGEFLNHYTLQELDKLRREKAIYKLNKDNFKHGVYAENILSP